MYITVDEKDSRPIYRQIVDEIKGLIATGELVQGTFLPPVRQVAADLGVNLNTVAFAYRQLQQEGLVKVRHGAGALVISRVLKEPIGEQTRSQLAAALTHLVLSGLKPGEIRILVDEELRRLYAEVT
jgi:GntR family transcriptional regulator